MINKAKHAVTELETRIIALREGREEVLIEESKVRGSICHQGELLQQLELDLQQSIEEEEYDRAAQLETEMKAAKAALATANADLLASSQRVQEALTVSLREEAQLLNEQVEVQRSTALKLEASLQSQLDELKAFRGELEDATRSERARIDNDRVKLQRYVEPRR
jgi:hypothetical protein